MNARIEQLINEKNALVVRNDELSIIIGDAKIKITASMVS